MTDYSLLTTFELEQSLTVLLDGYDDDRMGELSEITSELLKRDASKCRKRHVEPSVSR